MIDKKTIKSYPYFVAWLKELGRSVEDVEDISMEQEMMQVGSENHYKRFQPLDEMKVGMTFTDGQSVERRVPNGTIIYLAPEEVKRRDTSDALQIVRKVTQLDTKEYPELKGLIEEAHEFVKWIEGV